MKLIEIKYITDSSVRMTDSYLAGNCVYYSCYRDRKKFFLF